MIPVLVMGLGAELILIVAIVWSIAFPDKRWWPPKKSSHFGRLVVWSLTLAIFGSAIYLGITDWNRLDWPWGLRWAAGLPMILIGNIVVWLGVIQIGMDATSGDATRLQTGGLYRYTRNPQYMADMVILIGWAVLSASVWVMAIVAGGLLLLAITPLAEETWLKDVYGEEYESYRTTVDRYL